MLTSLSIQLPSPFPPKQAANSSLLQCNLKIYMPIPEAPCPAAYRTPHPSPAALPLGTQTRRRFQREEKRENKLYSQTTRALFGVIQSRMRGRVHSQFGHPRRASSRPHAGGLLRNGRKVIPSGRTPALLLLHSGSFIEFSVGRRLRGMATGMRLGPVVSKADELEDFCRKPEGVKVVFRC